MYTYPTRVVTSSTGPDGLQTILSTVTMMQDCSMLWMEDQPELRAWLDANNAAMMVASREVEIRRRPAFGERLEVRTWLYRFRGAMGFRNTCIFDESGEAVACCWAIGVFVGLEDGKVHKLPPEVIESIGLEGEFPMECGKRKIILPEVEGQALPQLTAQRSDIDFNGHVNNAQYVRMAYEFLDPGFEPTRLRIVHDGQAKLGDAIVCTRYSDADREVFTLASDDGRPFATVEFK